MLFYLHLKGLIVVGKGDPGQAKEMIRWKDPHPNKEVIYIGFRYFSPSRFVHFKSSWDSPIQYRNITVIDPRESHDFFLDKYQFLQPEILVNHPALADTLITTKSGQSFYGHRAILSCVSEYFWNLFKDSSVGNLYTLQVDLDINPSVVLEVLKYIYGLKITISDTNASTLLQFSQKFQFSDLQSKIEQLDLQNRETQIQHAPNFSKLLHNNILSDCTFIVEEQSFPAHKCIFAFGSETFFAMFKNSFRESQQVITLSLSPNSTGRSYST